MKATNLSFPCTTRRFALRKMGKIFQHFFSMALGIVFYNHTFGSL